MVPSTLFWQLAKWLPSVLSGFARCAAGGGIGWAGGGVGGGDAGAKMFDEM
jgi:uncharacterized membrane protein